MKLELKHITPYLPYELKIFEPLQSKGLILDLKMTTYNSERIGFPFLFEHGFYKIQYGLPILRPLKEYKEIEEVEIEFSQSSMQKFDDIFFLNIPVLNKFDYVDYNVMIAMFKNHIDIFGLIEKGLAIDVNTLKD